jgi:hypothetical protein
MIMATKNEVIWFLVVDEANTPTETNKLESSKSPMYEPIIPAESTFPGVSESWYTL